MEINKDFEEFFESLNKNEVQYLVVGGYAYAVYAGPRYTKALDIWALPVIDSRKKQDKLDAYKLQQI